MQATGPRDNAKADSGWNHAHLDIFWMKAPGDTRQLVRNAKVPFKDPSKTPRLSSIFRNGVKKLDQDFIFY